VEFHRALSINDESIDVDMEENTGARRRGGRQAFNFYIVLESE